MTLSIKLKKRDIDMMSVTSKPIMLNVVKLSAVGMEFTWASSGPACKYKTRVEVTDTLA
jgi:hypothetical protein